MSYSNNDDPAPQPVFATHMIVCPDCGNKRCPKAYNTVMLCTGSNALGQQGAQPQPEPEPVAWMQDTTAGLYVEPQQDKYHTVPLYAAPPRREWVELTEEAIRQHGGDAFGIDIAFDGRLMRFARAIEQASKERNT